MPQEIDFAWREVAAGHFYFQSPLGFPSGSALMLLSVLRSSSFRFGEKSQAYLPGTATKNGNEVFQPLSSALAKRLQEWVPKSTDQELWPTDWHLKAAKMLRVDLEAAGIQAETAEGVVDFHSLRVSYCTALARAGVPPTIAQKFMRHSTIQLTLQTYTKFTSEEESDAIEKLA